MNPGQLLGNSLEEEVKIEQWVAYAADINSFVGGHNYGKPYFEPVSSTTTICLT